MKKRCPECGEGKLFVRWNELRDTCERCQCPLRVREDETWFFMYVSTAAITGVFFILLFFTPFPRYLGQIGVGVLAFVVFLLSTERRKGFAIALDYFIDKRSEFPRH